MTEIKYLINCPQCGKKNTWHPENAYRPFCSERCKLLDLGGWTEESYRIPTEESPTDFDEEEDK